jgi:enoyl-CoA hydratase/carnithine racemase
MKLGAGDATDPARRAFVIRDDILDIQHAVAAPERCSIPVIAAVHGIVIGLGIDIISACDVRYAASDAKFSIKARYSHGCSVVCLMKATMYRKSTWGWQLTPGR